MDNEKKKGFILSMIVCLVTIAYVVYNTVGNSPAQKDIIHFMSTTITVPALILICYGFLIGWNRTLLQVLPQIVMTTFIVFVISCSSMVYTYHMGYIFDMLQNTVIADNVVLNIKESITFGTIIQQALILLVCACVGSGMGNKSAVILGKIKN